MSLVEAIGTGILVISVVAFILYLRGLSTLPTGERPKTPTSNRFGEHIGMMENPGYEETEDEKQG